MTVDRAERQKLLHETEYETRNRDIDISYKIYFKIYKIDM